MVSPGRMRASVVREKLALMSRMAGYRNRLVHVYHDVTPHELYTLCTAHVDDIGVVAGAIAAWVRAHPDQLDDTS